MNNRLLSFIFTENSNFGVAMLSSFANKYDWETDIYFVEPNITDYTKIKDFIIDYHPDIINFSFKSFERNQALDLAKFTSDLIHTTKNDKIIKVITGGIHPTLMPNEVIETRFFDAVIVGDGMGIWKDILDNYSTLNKQIIYGKHHNDKSVYTNFFYSNNQIERMKMTETATVITTIGCPYECIFCHSGNQDFFPFPIENVAKYVIELYSKYNVRNFHFLDDLFAYNIKRIRKFYSILKQHNSNILFSSQVSCRADRFDEEIAKEFIKIGVETVNFGIETASPRLLNFLNKKQPPQQGYNALQICHDFGLNCVVNLMFGIPTQNKDDYECTLDFIKKTKPDSVNCFIYAPYPGTKLYDYCFDNGYLPELFERSKFDWFNPNIDGTMNVQLKLNKVDYDLVNEYIEKINKEINEDKDKKLMEKLKIIDLHPWILIGTMRHYYFITTIKKLSKIPLNNYLGYMNIVEDSGFKFDDKFKPVHKFNKCLASSLLLQCCTDGYCYA